MRTARASAEVALAPEGALAVWSDTGRWSTFVEGFERLVELDASWPAVGAQAVWESGPEGRGRVRERVAELEPGRRLATEVTEEPLEGGGPRLRGRQTLQLGALWGGGEGGAPPRSRAELCLEYELVRGSGAPGRLTDLLFVRRALRDALRRTLERFADEAAREAAR